MIAGAVSASAQAISYVNDLNAPIQAQLSELRDGSATANNAINARYANSASTAANIGTIAAANVAAINAANIFSQPQFIKRDDPYLLIDDDLSPADMSRWQFKALTSSGNGVLRFAQVDDAGVTTYTIFDAIKTSVGATPYLNFSARPQLGGVNFLVGNDAIDATLLGGVAASGYAKLATAQSFAAGQAITQVNLAGTSFTPNCDTSTMFRLELTGASTINTPTAPRSGMVISFHLIQSTPGSTVTWSSVFKFAGGTAPTLSTASLAVDVFAFQYDSASNVWRQAGLNVS